ncbi:hypothetical protein BJ170DRAFT_195438 [Xylariales sp. AK1849]|nr:hypothetical protein BJ170DRAFT_195438 [Xylariales sp. AK1849]
MLHVKLDGCLIIPRLQGKQRAMMEGLFFSAWGDLINEYSVLDLTYENDRLPAMQGIATILGNVVGCRYFAGVWERNLADGLMWEPVDYPVILTGQQSVPTWSWVSVMGGISAGGHEPDTAQIHVRGMGTENALYLSGRLHQCRVGVEEQPRPPPCRSDRKLRDPPRQVPTYSFTLRVAVGPRDLGMECKNTCRFDGLRGSEQQFFALGLQLNKCNNQDYHYGLLLQKTIRKTIQGDDQVCFERVGKFWAKDRSWHALEKCEVCLI